MGIIITDPAKIPTQPAKSFPNLVRRSLKCVDKGQIDGENVELSFHMAALSDDGERGKNYAPDVIGNIEDYHKQFPPGSDDRTDSKRLVRKMLNAMDEFTSWHINKLEVDKYGTTQQTDD